MAATAPMSSPKQVGAAGSIARRWRELQGSESWEKLLYPLDADLRASLIAYGELAEAAYDGFNGDENTWNAGQCLYSRTGLLAASGVSHPEYYTVTKFLYANCGWGQPDGLKSAAARANNQAFFVVPVESLRKRPLWTQTNWIGYVAVATDEGKAALGRRDIVVAWRGTVEWAEWLDNILGTFMFAQFPKEILGPSADQDFAGAKVHLGFLSVYSDKGKSPDNNKVETASARDEVLAELEKQMKKYEGEETSITVTGHSLGATLATLNAVDIVANGYNVSPRSTTTLLGRRPSPVTAILFASPHVGNREFKDAFNSFPDLRSLHVRNDGDVVPLFPTHDLGYVHAVTKTLLINTNRSPYLRPRSLWTCIQDAVKSHNLECYLHGLAGDHGAGKKFKLVVDRDLALVNKSTNALKDKYPVPPNWWVTANCKYKGNGVIARFKLHNFKEE
uniref:Uncharacterized protein n=1 Tax=Avena sativa TaxID=4498 RepID=A0ACD5T7A3_AVESA